ncbi:MAG: hypothetical protein ACK5RL_01710 [Acidimicrobiales bacterium]
MEEFNSTWGAPLVVEVRPLVGERWVGMVEAGGLGGISAAFATPDPTRFCAVADGMAHLVAAEMPAEEVMPIAIGVRSVVAVEVMPIALIVTDFAITALGADGVLWEFDDLGADGLVVVSTSGGVVTCSAEMFDGSATLQLDASSGRLLRTRRPPF